MKKENFDSIMRGMEEAIAYTKGKKVNAIIHHFHKQEEVEIKPIREKLGMSQRQFAEAFGFALDSIRNWESKRRVPDTSAQVLLKVISYNPKTVMEALSF